GSRQYSQRASARRQTSCSSAGFMHVVHAGALQGEPRPGPEDPEPVSHPAVVLHLLLLRRRQRPLLGLEGQLAHPRLVLVPESEAQQFARRLGREIAAVRLDEPADDGGLARWRERTNHVRYPPFHAARPTPAT